MSMYYKLFFSRSTLNWLSRYLYVLVIGFKFCVIKSFMSSVRDKDGIIEKIMRFKVKGNN